MNNPRNYEHSGLVYDPEYGTWDKAEDSKENLGVKERGSRQPRLRRTLRNVGILALAGSLSYGVVHSIGDLNGVKAGSLGTHDVSVPSLWNDLVVDVQARIVKGF